MNENLKELLTNNNVSLERFFDETYDCFLTSMLEVIVAECTDESFKIELKNRLRQSANQKAVIKNIVFDLMKCHISDEESEIILGWVKAYFNKKELRINYEDSIKNRILKNQNYECNICGRTIELDSSELDHIIPFSMVGDELGEKNLQMLCIDCNRRKSNSVVYNLRMFLINKRGDK
jgi:CRISPR/Cas system Type II protein with McrA/HNH and RuvC-like nuclease domain